MPPSASNNRSSERRPIGWCPSCNKTQSCTRSQGSDTPGNGSYNCDECGATTHEPLIRLAVPFRDLGATAEGF
jgi:hypothetical protein